MPKFANQFEPHARIHTNPGTPEKVLYGPVFDENGTLDSDSVLFTHAEDFSLYRLGTWDSDTGHIIPEEMPVLILEAKTCLLGGKKHV